MKLGVKEEKNKWVRCGHWSTLRIANGSENSTANTLAGITYQPAKKIHSQLRDSNVYLRLLF